MSPGEAGSPPGPARGEGEAQGRAWGGAACQTSGSVRSAFGFADIMAHALPAAFSVTASVCSCLWHLGPSPVVTLGSVWVLGVRLLP